MGIKLSDALGPREIALGYGVSITVSPISFADLKAAEATAYRRARTRLMAGIEASDLTQADDDARRALEERIAGLAEELVLDQLAARHVTGWRGVFAEDGETPEPFSPAAWERFRSLVPFLVDRFRAELRMPAALLVAEGNASAP